MSRDIGDLDVTVKDSQLFEAFTKQVRSLLVGKLHHSYDSFAAPLYRFKVNAIQIDNTRFGTKVAAASQ